MRRFSRPAQTFYTYLSIFIIPLQSGPATVEECTIMNLLLVWMDRATFVCLFTLIKNGLTCLHENQFYENHESLFGMLKHVVFCLEFMYKFFFC